MRAPPRCCSPRETSPGSRDARPVSPSVVEEAVHTGPILPRRLWDHARRGGTGAPRSRGSSSSSTIPRVCGTIAISAQPSEAGSSQWLFRSQQSSPSSGRSQPASTESRVVLPEPDGPTSATISPARTIRSTHPRARGPPPDRAGRSSSGRARRAPDRVGTGARAALMAARSARDPPRPRSRRAGPRNSRSALGGSWIRPASSITDRVVRSSVSASSAPWRRCERSLGRLHDHRVVGRDDEARSPFPRAR